MALLSFDTFLPPSMTICLRGRILYNRHGDQNLWFIVFLPHTTRRKGTYPGDFKFYQRSRGEWSVRSHTTRPPIITIMNKEEQDKAKANGGWPSKNSIRKWTHICVVGDFINDKTTLFLNGKKINETEFKFSRSFPEDYFSEELRSSGDILTGFTVHFGRNIYDKAPIIGELMDINAWDRILDDKEMEAITDCTKFELRVGNIINMTSAFNVTGPLCERIELEGEELKCVETVKDILLPVRASSLRGAERQCNRLLKDSIGPFLRTAEKYASVYNRLKDLPKTEGFKDMCWHGNRVSKIGKKIQFHLRGTKAIFESFDQTPLPIALCSKHSTFLHLTQFFAKISS